MLAAMLLHVSGWKCMLFHDNNNMQSFRFFDLSIRFAGFKGQEVSSKSGPVFTTPSHDFLLGLTLLSNFLAHITCQRNKWTN